MKPIHCCVRTQTSLAPVLGLLLFAEANPDVVNGFVSGTVQGMEEVLSEQQRYMEGRLELTQYNTIYGVGGIGLYWMVCKMEKSGGPQPTLVLDWQNNIASDASCTQFQTIANLVYNII